MVSKLSSITDYLCWRPAPRSRTSAPLRIELEHVLDEQKARILAVDTTKGQRVDRGGCLLK